MATDPSWISAEWDAPQWIRAGITTRAGGYSSFPYNGLNLATHVGDEPSTVARNRTYVSSLLNLNNEPVWLNQVHGNRIISATDTHDNTADGVYSDQPRVICTVMTADCVPVLFCNQNGSRVAAIHVGWKGFCAAILDKTAGLFQSDIHATHVWIGPHIRSQNYEVGDDVRDACIARDNNLQFAFTRNLRGRWQADLESMIRHDLARHGITYITASSYCTYAEEGLFYSYRRDGRTGRMASMIWIDREPGLLKSGLPQA